MSVTHLWSKQAAMKTQLILFSLLLTSGSSFASQLGQKDLVGFPNTLGQRHFFTFVSKSTLKTKQISANLESAETNCRDNIKQVICLVEPVNEGEDFENRKCLEGGDSYAPHFEKIYDNYPPLLQKMFCSLKHLYIEKIFFGTAYAGTTKDQDGNPNGAVMGIRQSVLDEQLSLQTWTSWKEQLSFGGIKDAYTITPHLPQITASTPVQVNDLLYFILAHEFGHMFDFANSVNQFDDCSTPDSDDEEPLCDAEENSWSALSWATNLTPKVEFNFSLRSKLCFYFCNAENKLSVVDVHLVYESLSKKNFISTYAATNPYDDFADSLAYYVIDQKLNSSYVLDTKQNQTYDSMTKLKDPIFRSKYEYIENFLNKPDIKYP